MLDLISIAMADVLTFVALVNAVVLVLALMGRHWLPSMLVGIVLAGLFVALT
jgi:hypothetical protein